MSANLPSFPILMRFLVVACLVVMNLSRPAQADLPRKRAAISPVHAKQFEIREGQFRLDGKPFEIISGEMHYARIPPAYWRQRLRMAKACGLNAITTYVFWNLHEPERGKFDFKGPADIARFVKTAQEEGLWSSATGAVCLR